MLFLYQQHINNNFYIFKHLQKLQRHTDSSVPVCLLTTTVVSFLELIDSTHRHTSHAFKDFFYHRLSHNSLKTNIIH